MLPTLATPDWDLQRGLKKELTMIWNVSSVPPMRDLSLSTSETSSGTLTCCVGPGVVGGDWIRLGQLGHATHRGVQLLLFPHSLLLQPSKAVVHV